MLLLFACAPYYLPPANRESFCRAAIYAATVVKMPMSHPHSLPPATIRTFYACQRLRSVRYASVSAFAERASCRWRRPRGERIARC